MGFPYQKESRDSREAILLKLEQSGRVPSREKFRRMVCLTHMSTGGCPYNDRCVFLHDPRLRIDGIRFRPTRAQKEPINSKDSFYWPDMQKDDVCRSLNFQGLPDSNQLYTIPSLFSTGTHHNRALFSMWSHLVDTCQRSDQANDSRRITNRHLPGASRLPVFVRLSNTTDRVTDLIRIRREKLLDPIFALESMPIDKLVSVLTANAAKCGPLIDFPMSLFDLDGRVVPCTQAPAAAMPYQFSFAGDDSDSEWSLFSSSCLRDISPTAQPFKTHEHRVPPAPLRVPNSPVLAACASPIDNSPPPLLGEVTTSSRGSWDEEGLFTWGYSDDAAAAHTNKELSPCSIAAVESFEPSIASDKRYHSFDFDFFSAHSEGLKKPAASRSSEPISLLQPSDSPSLSSHPCDIFESSGNGRGRAASAGSMNLFGDTSLISAPFPHHSGDDTFGTTAAENACTSSPTAFLLEQRRPFSLGPSCASREHSIPSPLPLSSPPLPLLPARASPTYTAQTQHSFGESLLVEDELASGDSTTSISLEGWGDLYDDNSDVDKGRDSFCAVVKRGGTGARGTVPGSKLVGAGAELCPTSILTAPGSACTRGPKAEAIGPSSRSGKNKENKISRGPSAFRWVSRELE